LKAPLNSNQPTSHSGTPVIQVLGHTIQVRHLFRLLLAKPMAVKRLGLSLAFVYVSVFPRYIFKSQYS